MNEDVREPKRGSIKAADPRVGSKTQSLAKKLKNDEFPDQLDRNSTPPLTIDNTSFLLDRYGIHISYDVIKKRIRVSIPGFQGTEDNSANSKFALIQSLFARQGMQTGSLAQYLAAIADRNAYNPAKDWILSKPWDGQSRLADFYATVEEQDDYPTSLKYALIRRWLISAVAAALMSHGFRNRGVLTLQGPQGIGKTSWILKLIPDSALRDQLVKIDFHFDGSKDAVFMAASHWIVEIGELDSSFRKDVARLKGFLTSPHDKLRRPYDRLESEYPRRTIFVATVNDNNFLIDPSGNTRFWTISINSLNYEHDIDMQQVFAEAAQLFKEDEQWWLTPKEEQDLGELNRQHQVTSIVRERVLDRLNLRGGPTQSLTCSELLEKVGFTHPTNQQARECGAVLREVLGPPKRIQGRERWHVSLQHTPFDDEDDESRYGEMV